METIAQVALKAFEDGWLTTDWAVLTANQKQTHIGQHYGLKIAAAKEIEANRIEAEQQALIDAETRRQQAITYLTGKGFACDNSLADWQLLYNHPKVFGANWNEQAVYQKSIADAKEAELAGAGLDWFLQTAYNFWVEYVKD